MKQKEEKTVNQFEYVIGERVFIQRKIVLGQLQQLIKLLKGFILPENVRSIDFISVIGDKLPEAISIILIEKSTADKMKDKNTAEYIEYFLNNLDIEIGWKVVNDFFVCNQTSALFQEIAQKIQSMMKPEKKSA